MFLDKIKEKLHIKGLRQNAAYIKIVCQETGWTRDKAKAHMDEFAAKGIDYDTYVKQRLYRSSKKRIQRKLELMERKKGIGEFYSKYPPYLH